MSDRTNYETDSKNPRIMRRFGFVMALGIFIVFGITLPFVFNRRTSLWPWLVAGGFALVSAFAPLVLGRFYVAWMAVAEALGRINTRIVLFLVFSLVFVPVGLFMRLIGRDPLRLSVDRTSSSYRITRNERRRPSHMQRPF